MTGILKFPLWLLALLAPALAWGELRLPAVPDSVDGAPSATVQRQADEWLLVRVVQVQQQGQRIRAVGVILRTFVSASELNLGDIIYIDYDYSPPRKVTEGRTPYVGFGTTPPLLTGGEVTYAFLRQTGEWLYEPAAGAWSFAPPAGLWPEVVQSLEMDAYLQPEETDPSPASSGEKAVAQKQPPAPPEPVTVFLESEGNSFARVSSQSTGQVVFEGRLRPNTYVGVTGVPPLLLEATDYGPFLVELPGRERVEPVPGRDFGVLRVAAATDLTAPAPDAGLGAPPPVYRGERQITPGSPGEGTALGTEATGEAGQPLPFFQRERVRPAQEETSTGGGESPSAPTGPPADEKARSEAAASPGEAPAPEADESGVKPEPGPSAEPSEDPSTGPRAKQPTD